MTGQARGWDKQDSTADSRANRKRVGYRLRKKNLRTSLGRRSAFSKSRNQLAFRKEMVMLSRFAKGWNPLPLPEWEFSATISQPALSMRAT